MIRGLLHRLTRPLSSLPIRVLHAALLTRLRLEAWRASRLGPSRRPRIAATACWKFPIYSQTFVHQEALSLARSGVDLRFFYGRLGSRSDLAEACAGLWDLSRLVLQNEVTGRADLAYYRRRMPQAVEAVLRRLSAASGLPLAEVERHPHVLHAFSFTRAVEAWGADYVHSYFFYEQTLFASVAASLLDLPRGVSCYADHLLDDYPLKVVPLHLDSCAVIVATSRRIRAELEQIHGGPLPAVLVKPNAIDAETFTPRSGPAGRAGQPLGLVCICRIDPKKGLEYVIDAVHLLIQRGLPVAVRLLGAADATSAESVAYETALRAQADRLGLHDAVHFAGRQNSRQVRDALETADVFIASSVELPNGDKDGIPTSVLEAMAAGSVMVVTDAGSIVEVVDHERDGLVVPQRDAGALADAITRVATDEALASRLRVAAAARARREFDIRVTESSFHTRVRAALEAHGRAPGANRVAS